MRRALCMVAFLLAGSAFCATLKFASVAPEGTTWMNQMRALAQDVARATQGRVTLRLYPGGVSGDERDVLRKIRAGQLHGAGFTGNGLGELVPAVRVLETPFLLRDYAEYDSVLVTVQDTLASLFRERGFELGGWASVGWVYLFSKNPIASVRDLRRARPWVWETDPLATALFAKVGVSPIALPLPQVLTSLQTGVIDVAYASPSAAVSLQWFTRVKHMTDFPLTHSTGAVIISSQFLDRLSPEDRHVTLRLFREHLQRLEPLIRREEQRALEVLREEGISFVRVDSTEAQLFAQVGTELRRDLAGKLYPAWLLALVEQRLAEVRRAG